MSMTGSTPGVEMTGPRDYLLVMDIKVLARTAVRYL